ncbi:hypothetical protein AOLI_G00087950 [Acnodon oligacanthus]
MPLSSVARTQLNRTLPITPKLLKFLFFKTVSLAAFGCRMVGAVFLQMACVMCYTCQQCSEFCFKCLHCTGRNGTLRQEAPHEAERRRGQPHRKGSPGAVCGSHIHYSIRLTLHR